jgi:hypothetical protein
MSHFDNYVHLLRDPQFSFAGDPMAKPLLVSSHGDFETFYAPFDHINLRAKIVICGITPGKSQAFDALNAIRESLLSGDSADVAKQKAKEVASFSGTMRNNLINMLDHVGIHELLGISGCATLFGSHKHLVHYTSALRNPVFKKKENYSGKSPSLVKSGEFLKVVEQSLADEIKALPSDCIYVPLGEEVWNVFSHLESKGLVKPSQVIHGMIHPSGASNERISYFLGRKARQDLSKQTNADKIDLNKARMLATIKALKAARCG